MNYCCPKEGKHRTLLSYESLEIKNFFFKSRDREKIVKKMEKNLLPFLNREKKRHV